jgi:hypothetical protein
VDHLLNRFIRHLTNGACGDPGCLTDKRLAVQDDGQRAEFALADLIKHDRLWNQRPGAQQVLKTLPAALQRRLENLDSTWNGGDGGSGALAWQKLIKRIADDQRWFESMLPDGPRRLLPRSTVIPKTDQEAEQQEAERVLKVRVYELARKAWPCYARQALILVERSPLPAGPPYVQDVTVDIVRQDDALMATLRGRPPMRERARYDLRGLTDKDRAYVLHWFAHALRGLVRYANGDELQPFSTKCARNCINKRNRFSLRPQNFRPPQK